MDEYYYISFWDKSSQTLNYPHDLVIEKLDSIEQAIKRLDNLDEHLEFDYENYKDEEDSNFDIPFYIITNDLRLYKKYRNAISKREFEAYSIDSNKDGNEIDTLPNKYKYIAYSSRLTGLYATESYNHFLNIIAGNYQKAFMYRKTDVWYEEDSGNSYEYEIESGWKTEIKKIKFTVEDCVEVGSGKFRNTLINENNPNKIYQLYTNQKNEIGSSERLNLTIFHLEEIKKVNGKSIILIKPKIK